MPSSYTTSLRFELQFTGENVNLWGDKLNAALSRADDAVAGWLTKPLTGDYTLTTANGAADEARRAMLKFTGTGPFTVTIPAVSKRYDVWNACTGDLTLTNGSASVVVKPGEVVSVVTDGGGSIARVQPTDFGGARIVRVGMPTSGTDAATKRYVDDTAFEANAGILPGQAGNAGRFLTTDGTTASWDFAVSAGAGMASVASNTVTVTGADAAAIRLGTSTTNPIAPGSLYSSLDEVTLTYSGSNIVTSGATLDNTAFVNAGITLTQNSTLPNPTNPVTNRTGRIRVVQDGTTARTLAFGSNWKWPNNVIPIMTVTLGAIAFIDYEVVSSTYIRANMTSMG